MPAGRITPEAGVVERLVDCSGNTTSIFHAKSTWRNEKDFIRLGETIQS